MSINVYKEDSMLCIFHFIHLQPSKQKEDIGLHRRSHKGIRTPNSAKQEEHLCFHGRNHRRCFDLFVE